MARTWFVHAAVIGSAIAMPVAHSAQAQHTTLVGLIRDSSGHPIPGVEVRLAGQDLLTHTNDLGGFRLASMPVGAVKISARRLGFAPAIVDLTLRVGRVDSLVLSLSTLAASLPGVVVEDEYMKRSKRLLAGFWERRSRGFGHFVTRDEIERGQAHDFVDVVRMTPGLQLIQKNGRRVIRFGRGGRSGSDCPPQYWVDGIRIEQASPDEFTPEQVEAIELYTGPATLPAQFSSRGSFSTCGAVVIWTRIPGP
jgi:hypothetical protein